MVSMESYLAECARYVKDNDDILIQDKDKLQEYIEHGIFYNMEQNVSSIIEKYSHVENASNGDIISLAHTLHLFSILPNLNDYVEFAENYVLKEDLEI